MKKILKLAVIFLLAIAPWLVISKTLYLVDPPPWPDEAIYVETANNILKTGELKTTLFGDAIPGLSKHALWYPPLYFYVLAEWMKLFGQSIETIRFLSFISAFLTLAIFFYMLQKLFSRSWFSFLGVLILSSDMYFSAASRVARMDMLNFFFIMLSIFFFIKAIGGNKKWLFVVVGTFCGLALLTHPYGMIAPAVLFIYLLLSNYSFKTKIGFGIYMLVPILIAFFVWIYLIGPDMNLFFIQYKLQFLRKSREEIVPLSVVKENDYLWFSIYACYFIFVITLIVKILKKYNVRDLFYLLAAFISVFVAVWGKEFWFLLYFQPFLIIIALSVLNTIGKSKKVLITAFFYAPLFAILTLNIYYYVGYILEIRNHIPNYHEYTKFISRDLPRSARIYLAVIPDPYFDLRKNADFSFYEFPTVPVTYEASKKLLDDSDFIIYNLEDNLDENQFIRQYYTRNTHKISTVRLPGGYTAFVMQLVAKDKRR